jgi:hypothetical protein
MLSVLSDDHHLAVSHIPASPLGLLPSVEPQFAHGESLLEKPYGIALDTADFVSHVPGVRVPGFRTMSSYSYPNLTQKWLTIYA